MYLLKCTYINNYVNALTIKCTYYFNKQNSNKYCKSIQINKNYVCLMLISFLKNPLLLYPTAFVADCYVVNFELKNSSRFYNGSSSKNTLFKSSLNDNKCYTIFLPEYLKFC